MEKNNKKLSALINEASHTLTNRESEIASYVLSSIVDVSEINLKNITEKTKTSFSTFYGFLEKIGFTNIKELAFAYNEEKNNNEQSKRLFNTDDTEIEETGIEYLRILKENTELLSINKIDSIIELLFNANNIYLVGLGESNLVANEIYFRLTRFGLSAFVIDGEVGTLITKVMTLKNNDILICVSNSGESRVIVEAAKIASKNNVKTYAITSREQSSLSDIVNNYIKLSFPPKRNLSESYISSLLPAIYLCDLVSRRILTTHSSVEDYRKSTSDIITKLVKIKE